MSPVPLTDEAWATINADLPDTNFVQNRIVRWPRADLIHCEDIQLLRGLRLSNVCFRNAMNNIYNARYALGQAVGVRKHFLSLSQANQDNDHALADLRSRFYADYVPLLLWSASEHTLEGICILLDIRNTQSGEDKLKQLMRFKEKLKSALAVSSEEFNNSFARKAVWKYRHQWVHNEPPRVETIFYNPPRRDYIMKEGSQEIALSGVNLPPPDFSWEELIILLKDGLRDSANFLYACAEEWEHTFTTSAESIDSFLDSFIDSE